MRYQSATFTTQAHYNARRSSQADREPFQLVLRNRDARQAARSLWLASFFALLRIALIPVFRVVLPHDWIITPNSEVLSACLLAAGVFGACAIFSLQLPVTFSLIGMGFFAWATGSSLAGNRPVPWPEMGLIICTSLTLLRALVSAVCARFT